jgi:hypothetical protein
MQEVDKSKLKVSKASNLNWYSCNTPLNAQPEDTFELLQLVMVENEYFRLLARAHKIIFEICCGEPMAGSSRSRIGAQSRDSMLQRAGGVPMGMGAAGDDSQQTAGMENPYCFHHSLISAWKSVKGPQEERAKRNRAVDEDEK